MPKAFYILWWWIIILRTNVLDSILTIMAFNTDFGIFRKFHPCMKLNNVLYYLMQKRRYLASKKKTKVPDFGFPIFSHKNHCFCVAVTQSERFVCAFYRGAMVKFVSELAAYNSIASLEGSSICAVFLEALLQYGLYIFSRF